VREEELMDNTGTKTNGYEMTINKFSDHNWIPSLQRPDEPFSGRSRREIRSFIRSFVDLTASSHPSVPLALCAVDFDPFPWLESPALAGGAAGACRR